MCMEDDNPSLKCFKGDNKKCGTGGILCDITHSSKFCLMYDFSPSYTDCHDVRTHEVRINRTLFMQSLTYTTRH